jgi:hypothetical protein
MINPNMPNIPGMPGFPGMGSVTDSLEFVKNLWGSMGIPGLSAPNMSVPGIPGMVVPTFSVEEIRKRISDLKAVETWLDLNMNMLRGTIQALEVQAATLSTLQSMGDAFTASMASAGAAGQATQQKPGTSYPSSFASSATGSTSQEGAPSAQQTPGATEPSSKDQADAAALTAPLVNAAAWWNMLQDQFKQAVSTAMTADMGNAPSPASGNPNGKDEPNSDSGGDSSGATEPGSVPNRRRRASK